MTKSDEKFVAWSQVARQLHTSSRPEVRIKSGAIYWCHLGQNIGSEENGKGTNFTRPVLILRRFNSRIVLIAPLTTKLKAAPFLPKVIVSGEPNRVILTQIRSIDVLRLGGFIDELDPQNLKHIRELLIRNLQKETSAKVP